MRILDKFEVLHISGGHCANWAEEASPFVFYSTGIGTVVSLIYALAVAEKLSAPDIGSNILAGVGLFALVGLSLGTANYQYRAFSRGDEKQPILLMPLKKT